MLLRSKFGNHLAERASRLHLIMIPDPKIVCSDTSKKRVQLSHS